MNPKIPVGFPALIALTLSMAQSAEISIDDLSLAPDGGNSNEVQQTQINTLNDGGADLLPRVNGGVIYQVTTFTFGAGSDAHFVSRFNATGGQSRLGVRVQDSGLIDFVSTGDPGRTSFNLGPDLAGETVTLLIKQEYDNTNDSLRATNGGSDDNLMTVWVNPDSNAVEGSGLGAGDMQTLWNSDTYRFFTQTIENQGTPGAAGISTITNTIILSGSDATFANALALATGTTSTGIVDAGTSTVSASPQEVPADGATSSTVTVTLKEDSGLVVSGKEVSLSGNGSATITTGSAISDANGEVAFLVSSSAVGIETFTATMVTDGNLVIAETADVEFQLVIPVGPVDAGNSSLLASPDNVPANGITTSTLTVTLRDSNDQLVVGEGVTLSGSPSNATISPSASLTTDANGQAEFTVSSDTIGTVVFTAQSSSDSITVNQTASVEFTDPLSAQAFNVSFLDEGQAESAGLIGVVGELGETWNHGTTSVSNLIDTTGNLVSSVSVTGLGADGRTINADLNLFDGVRNIFGKGSDTTIAITGLIPNAAYDLYLYGLSHNTASWGDLSNSERAAGDFVASNPVAGNGQSQFLDNAVAGTNDQAFVLNGNYVVFQSILADNSGGISVLADAYDGDGASGPSATRLHVNALQIRPATGASVDYSTWVASSYPGLGSPDEDDDADGFSNDFERIFGLDPTDAASANPYTSPFDPGDGFFGYSRRSQALTNLNFKVWYSFDLETWFEDNAANQFVQAVENDIEMMGAEIDPALLSESKVFVQVRATPITEIDVAPELVNLWGSGNTITLLFSEPMNSSSAGNFENYQVSRDDGGSLAVTDAVMSSDGGRVTLTVDSTLGLATGYTVGIDGVTSSTGQSFGSVLNRQFTTWDNDPNGIKVFILAGQSNMVGFANAEDGATGAGGIGSLRYLAENNASYPEYDYASLLETPGEPATSPFKNRPDVKIWYRDGGNGQLGGAVKKGDLGPPYMGRDNGKFGPEFAFGQVMGDFYGSNDVLIIKTSWGGHDLATRFRPPSAVAKRGGQIGSSYNAMIEYSRQVLNNLGSEFPDWAGRGYEIVGFGWHQGYNDRISTTASAEYEENLPDFIGDIRDVFSKSNLPFVIASTGMGGLTPIEDGPYPSYSAVERAQLWDLGVARPSNVLSTDTRPFWRDPADSPATSGQGFHWNHNAETYFLIGKTLGDDMIDLLSP